MKGKIAYTQKEVFKRFIDEFDITGKKILDIGGKLTEESIELLTCKKWVSIDLNNSDKIIQGRYEEKKGDARLLCFEDEEFDFIFACNSFEHIQNLEIALSEMYRVLKKGGILYSNFGPIWSAPDGHHLDIVIGDVDYSFWKSKTLNLFEHLYLSEKELQLKLEQSYEKETVSKIIKSVFYSNWINRYSFEDYIRIFVMSNFIIEDIMTNNFIDYSYDKSYYVSKLENLEEGYSCKKNIRCRDIEVILRK